MCRGGLGGGVGREQPAAQAFRNRFGEDASGPRVVVFEAGARIWVHGSQGIGEAGVVVVDRLPPPRGAWVPVFVFDAATVRFSFSVPGAVAGGPGAPGEHRRDLLEAPVSRGVPGAPGVELFAHPGAGWIVEDIGGFGDGLFARLAPSDGACEGDQPARPVGLGRILASGGRSPWLMAPGSCGLLGEHGVE